MPKRPETLSDAVVVLVGASSGVGRGAAHALAPAARETRALRRRSGSSADEARGGPVRELSGPRPCGVRRGGPIMACR